MNTNEDFKRFVILLTQIPGVETTEALIRRHVAYLRELDRRGQLVICGPFTDYPGGMVIIKAESLESAKQIASDDPFVIEKSRTPEVRSWLLSCEENSHLGMG